MDPRTFQLYLLSLMSAEERVGAALAGLKASKDEMRQAAQRANLLGLDAVHAAALYIEMLGPPMSSAADITLDPQGPFAGSLLLRFRLPVWPDFDFGVRQHPLGYAWGRCFLRSSHGNAPPLNTSIDLAPWRVVASEVVAAFGPPEGEDAWNEWQELRYLIPISPQASRRSYLLRFDLGLLQTVRLLG